jgi:hypothetical protein
MHRQILGLEYGDKRQGDHVEPSATLDNRRLNIRIATAGENQRNSRKRRDNSSGVKGVSVDSRSGKLRVRIQVDGVTTDKGLHAEREVAAQIRRSVAIEKHGEFARF